MPKNYIISVIDLFYPPFRKFMPRQTFRYVACGGGNTLLDIVLYFISYHFILNKQVLELGPIAISPHIAAFIIAFCISFPTGFYLMRSIVFTDSTLRGRVQLFRYFLLVAVCIMLNYAFLKLFVEQWGIYPTPSKILTTIIVVSFSYLTQKHFTFRVKKGIEQIQ
ncbi:MAG TPA: GtrA family protein [Chitinophagaceae bacterium]